MVIVTIWCDTCKGQQPCITLNRKPWLICSGCRGDEFNQIMGYDQFGELPKIVQPSKGEY